MRSVKRSWKIAETCAVVFLSVIAVRAANQEKIIEKLKVPEQDQIQVINTVSGATVIGRITAVNDLSVTFATDMGSLVVAIADIKSLEEFPVENMKHGKFWFPNPNTTRLFLSPTGRMLEQGKGYFADYYVFVPMLSYGFNGYFNLSGGVSMIPFMPVEYQAVYLMPKFAIVSGEQFSLAAGALLASTLDYLESGVGAVYTVATLGSPDYSLTAGIGYGFMWEPNWDYWSYYSTRNGIVLSGMQAPTFVVGGEARICRRMSLVTENWIVPGLYLDIPVVLSYGVRFFGQELSVDLGFINPLEVWSYGEPLFPGIPYVDFVYNF